ncbi:MAG: hypothetical protein HY436_02010, partial [Candidatus Liptonbacteria bacterium]|nr:hypothetical protein [Candidatus Liptonbacteria bacterium]
LGTLIACAAFFSAGELLALTLAAIFLLAWQPSLGAESAGLAVLPFLALLLYRRIPFFRGLPGLLAASAGAALAFTALSRPSFFLAEPFLTLADAAGSVIFAMIVFALFRSIYGERIVY